jgi:integrase
LAAVLANAKLQAERSANARRNLIVVRLACCCGLRVSEIAGLQLGDVLVEVARPHLRLRRETTKGKRARMVPLWWDAGTLADLRAWKAERQAQGASVRDPLVCSVQSHRLGLSLRRSGGDFFRLARCWGWRDCGPSPSITAGTHTSRTRLLVAEHWPR